MKKRKKPGIIAELQGAPICRKILFATAITTLIVLILSPIILSHNRMGWIDWDIFFAYHEAMRQAIITYHQFPWWNPWMYGGVPLFANPQIGLISIETPFILIFGTLWGMKLAAVIYFIAGYWGMYWLLKALKTPLANRVFISFIWIFSTFVTFHFYVGHFTFLLYLLSPWLFFLALKFHKSWGWAVAFGLFIGFFINSNLHYMTVQAIFLLAFWLIARFFLSKDKKNFALKLAAAMAIALVTTLPKLYFSDKYVSDFAVPGSSLIQQVTSLKVAWHFFVASGQTPFQNGLVGKIGGWEISAYIGTTAIILFAISAGYFCYSTYKKRKVPLGLIFLGAAILCFVIGLGPFAEFSPYALLSHVPVLQAMQVPSRWFGWTIFFALLTMGQFKLLPKISGILLAAAAIELMIIQPFRSAFPFPMPGAITSTTGFQEYEGFAQLSGYENGKNIGSDMYQSTISNYGEVDAYEPILNRVLFNQHQKGVCGINVGCKLVSNNAKITYWSPNDIKLQRIASGPITLNVSPGSYWLVNGKRLFANDRVTEPEKKFIINDPAKNIDVKISPL